MIPAPDQPYDFSYIERFWDDPAFAAAEKAKAIAEREAFMRPRRERRRAEMEAIWAADDLPDTELRA